MSDDAPNVLLVFGKFSSSFTALPWMLARDGRLRVDILCPDNHVVRKSAWARAIHTFSDIGVIAERLRERLRERPYDLVLYTDEIARDAVLREKACPELGRHAPFGDATGLGEALRDKDRFYRWCADHQIRCLASQTATSRQELRRAAETIGFPVLLKPAVGTGGRGIATADSPEALERVLEEEAFAEGNRWIVQRFLDGPVGSVTMVCLRGRVLGYCTSEKFVALGGGRGPSAIRKFIDPAPLEPTIRTMAEAGAVTGITGFDWMRDSDGTFYVIDPHFGRVTPPSVASHFAGLRIDRVLENALRGGDAKAEAGAAGPIVWMMPQVIELAFQGGLPAALKKSLRDPAPLRFFPGGRREWRMLAALYREYTVGQLKILWGRLTRR